MNNSSRLLVDEPPLQVLPTLACALGLQEAIVVQQLHYWLQVSTHFYDDRRWVFNTYEDWQRQFPWWSIDTIKRLFLALQQQGIVLSSTKFNKIKIDKTKWYALDYDKLNSLCDVHYCTSMRANPHHGQSKNAPCDEGKSALPMTRKETTAETMTTDRAPRPSSVSWAATLENDKDAFKRKFKNIRDMIDGTPLNVLQDNFIIRALNKYAQAHIATTIRWMLAEYKGKPIKNPQGLITTLLKGMDKPIAVMQTEIAKEQQKGTVELLRKQRCVREQAKQEEMPPEVRQFIRELIGK